MVALCAFVRASALAYVNNQGGNTSAPDGAGSARFMAGLHYASAVATPQAGAEGRPPTPPRYAQGVRSAPPALSALATWPHAHASGSAGAFLPPRGALDANLLGHRAHTMGPSSPYGHGGGSGVALTSAASRPSLLATAAGVASAPQYGSGGGGAAALGAAAGHQTTLSVVEQGTGSSAYAPFCGPHGRLHFPVPQGEPAANSFTRRGPVDDEDDDEEVGDEGDEAHTPHGSPGPASPRPMAGVLPTAPTHKKRRGAATTRCSPLSASQTRRGEPLGAGGVATASGAAVGAGGCAGVGGGPLQQPRAGSLAATGARSPASGAVSPRSRGRSTPASGATPPARAGGASSTAVAGGTASAGLVTVTHVNEIVRTTGVGLSSVRREMTTLRKEVAIMNSQLRAVTKKVDDVAVLADRLTVSLVFQRRTLVSMSGDITSVLSDTAANRAAASPPATGGAEEVRGGRTAGRCAGADAETAVRTEEQDAQWVLDLKVCLFSTGTSSGTASGPGCAVGCIRSRSACGG